MLPPFRAPFRVGRKPYRTRRERMRKLFRHLQAGVLTMLGAAFLAGGVAHADPVINGLSRDRAPLMSVISIYGTDLGEAQGSNYVLVGGHGVPILAWSNTVILFLLNPLA